MIKKRDGRIVEFDKYKIEYAIIGAMKDVNNDRYDIAKRIANDIALEVGESNFSVDDINDKVENKLMASSLKDVAKQFIRYRYKRETERSKDIKIKEQMKKILRCEDIKNSNANVDEYSFGGRKFESAGIQHKELALEEFISKDISDAHKAGKIYIHDLDSYDVGMHNCLFVDVGRLLKNGFKTRNGDVRSPKSISTAMQQIAVIFQCQSQVQFGGCADAHLDYDLAPFVAMSFQKHFDDGLKYVEENLYDYNSLEIKEKILSKLNIQLENKELQDKFPKTYQYAYDMTERECSQSAQGLYHNLNTLESRAGSQLPFTSINFGRDTSPEGRMITKAMLNASLDGIGKLHKTSIFPISIFQYKKGVNDKKGTPNYDTKQLAIKSLSKRIYPNFVNCDFSNHVEDSNNIDTMSATMGCRTAMSYDRNGLGYSNVGRGNVSPITIILPRIGIRHGICLGERKEADLEGFWKELDELLVLTKKGLLERMAYISSQNPKSAPFMYENGTIADADKCIDNVFEAQKHGSQAIGYIGIAEMCQALFGKNHIDKDVREFALSVVKHIYDFAQKASDETGLNFGTYASPSESLCNTALNKLKEEFGVIENITDKEFITNSHHVPVWEEISAFEKIDIEAPFCWYATSGCITYAEFDSKIIKNPEAVESIIDYAMDKDIPYFAINFPIDTCLDCGYADDMSDTCLDCGSPNIEHLARCTGYLTSDVSHFNKGKQDEVRRRYKHSKKNTEPNNK